MSTKLILQLAADDAVPTDIASLLEALSQIERPQFRLLVACENAAQAGQVRRRVREALDRNGGAGQFDLDRSTGAPYWEVTFPAATDAIDIDALADEEAEHPPVQPRMPEPAKHAAPPAPEPVPVKELAEGNYKVRLVTLRKEQFGAKYFVTVGLEVVEGPHKGRRFEDRVIVWPVTGRTEHLARALGIEPAALGDQIDQSVGKEFWDRRREAVKRDGSPQLANYYYSLESPPPPVWAGFAR